MAEKEKIELRSEEFQEILGRVPSWILRYGLIIIGSALVIVLIGSAVFKYPDTISTTMTLTRTYPPTALVARASGKLQDICVADNQQVKAGEYLAVIENPAGQRDVFSLKAYLQQYAAQSPDTIVPLPPKDLKLGSMQTLFSSFYTTLFEHNEFIRLQYYPQKISYTRKRVGQLREYYNGLVRQHGIVSEQATLSDRQYQRDVSLHGKGVISDETIETSKSQELQSKLSVESIDATLQNTAMQITQMEESLLDLEYQYQDKKNTFKTQLHTYLTQLLTEIQAWEQNYVFISPIDGKITFTHYWTENQYIPAGDMVFHIVPAEKGELIGKAIMEMSRSGKVKPGQRVNIRFLNFDDTEYGIVKGIVRTISLVPVKGNTADASINHYVVEIELPEGLRTTYNKELPYLPEMQAQADIVTEDISLLERFFMPIRKIWTEGMGD